MIAIKIEGRINYKADKGFSERPIWKKERIIDAYNSELEYLKGKLFWL
jgi:hypothetical protein